MDLLIVIELINLQRKLINFQKIFELLAFGGLRSTRKISNTYLTIIATVFKNKTNCAYF